MGRREGEWRAERGQGAGWLIPFRISTDALSAANCRTNRRKSFAKRPRFLTKRHKPSRSLPPLFRRGNVFRSFPPRRMRALFPRCVRTREYTQFAGGVGVRSFEQHAYDTARFRCMTEREAKGGNASREQVPFLFHNAEGSRASRISATNTVGH